MLLCIEVKIRGPNQGLGPIPVSKKWGSGINPWVQKIMLLDQSLRLLLLWYQNSIFSDRSRSETNSSIKKWGSETNPRVPKIMVRDQSLRLLVLWSKNSIFLFLGLDPRTRNCYLWDQILSSNPISSSCGELMGLWPMLLPNLAQIRKYSYHQIPEEGIWGSGINPRVHKMLFWDRSQYSDGSVS